MFRIIVLYKMMPVRKAFSKNGTSVPSRISVYKGAFIFPSKIHIGVLPLRLIPAQMCTFTGCFALYVQDKYRYNVSTNTICENHISMFILIKCYLVLLTPNIATFSFTLAYSWVSVQICDSRTFDGFPIGRCTHLSTPHHPNQRLSSPLPMPISFPCLLPVSIGNRRCHKKSTPKKYGNVTQCKEINGTLSTPALHGVGAL